MDDFRGTIESRKHRYFGYRGPSDSETEKAVFVERRQQINEIVSIWVFFKEVYLLWIFVNFPKGFLSTSSLVGDNFLETYQVNLLKYYCRKIEFQ